MTTNSELELNPEYLTASGFDRGIQELIQRDRDLAKIVDTWGHPPQWQRNPGFPTLIQIILEQQVSLASAKATFDRLCNLLSPLTPKNFLSLDDGRLKAIGFSRQKTRYGRELASAIVSGRLNLEELDRLDNLTIRKQLTKIKGIGDWTVDMYLMMALQRRDIFPSKDLAVAISVQQIKGLSTRPPTAELELIAELWRPWRATKI